jgi:hypothetical protein
MDTNKVKKMKPQRKMKYAQITRITQITFYGSSVTGSKRRLHQLNVFHLSVLPLTPKQNLCNLRIITLHLRSSAVRSFSSCPFAFLIRVHSRFVCSLCVHSRLLLRQLDKGVRAGEVGEVDQALSFVGMAGGPGELTESFLGLAPEIWFRR